MRIILLDIVRTRKIIIAKNRGTTCTSNYQAARYVILLLRLKNF